MYLKKTVTNQQVKSFVDAEMKYIFQSRNIVKSFVREHRHSFYEIILVTSGSCLHKVNKSDFVMSEGDFIILAPGDSHRLSEGNPKCEVFCISVSRDEFKKYEALFGTFYPMNKPMHLPDESLVAIRNLLSEYSNTEVNVVAACSVLLAGARDSLGGSSDGIPKGMKDMLDKLRGDVSLQREGVSAMLRLSCYSRAQLTRLMRRHLGVSPHEFIKDLRLSTARQLTIDTSISLEAIAEECGYKCYGYFTDVFKERYRITPAALRKQRS